MIDLFGCAISFVCFCVLFLNLKGNRFTITLRNISISADSDSSDDIDLIISSALNYVKENGFINYFGMQRFGTGSIPTHSVGIAILKRRWDRVLAMLLLPR